MNNKHVVITVQDRLIYKIRRFMQVVAYRVFGPVVMAKIYYRIVMKEKLDLKNPRTFTEKINWYKLYFCPQNKLIIQCSDKYTVREFLKNNGMEQYLPELVGVWKDANEINWESLPNKFALKISNGCGYNIICDNKQYLDERAAKKLLSKWMKESFGCYNAEPHYNVGEKCVICEKYIESENILPLDYKIHCMNGSPKIVQLCAERTSAHSDYSYYDINCNPLKFGEHPAIKPLDVDEKLFAEMLDVSKEIAPKFPYVRVDFFINNNKLQISELTFSPSAGLKPDLKYGNGDLYMGEMLDLSQVCI